MKEILPIACIGLSVLTLIVVLAYWGDQQDHRNSNERSDASIAWCNSRHGTISYVQNDWGEMVFKECKVK